jgi:hypothetical protein
MDQQRQGPAGPPRLEKLVAAPLDGPPRSRSGRGLQGRLRQHGRYSTHITIAEWKSHPDQCGCPVTASPYPRRTQKLAFKVERVRHRLGDIPIRVISAYRNRCHERCIGGALAYHLRGQAVDPVKPSGMSTTTWNAPWLREFGGGGIERNTSVIRHVDTGPRRRWFYD